MAKRIADATMSYGAWLSNVGELRLLRRFYDVLSLWSVALLPQKIGRYQVFCVCVTRGAQQVSIARGHKESRLHER